MGGSVSTTSEPTRGPRIAIGVDIGGSGIKAASVDVSIGALVGERIRVATPNPSTPESVVEATAKLVARLERSPAVTATGSVGPLPVGIGIPSVVVDGITWSAANIDPGWLDYPAELE